MKTGALSKLNRVRSQGNPVTLLEGLSSLEGVSEELSLFRVSIGGKHNECWPIVMKFWLYYRQVVVRLFTDYSEVSPF